MKTKTKNNLRRLVSLLLSIAVITSSLFGFGITASAAEESGTDGDLTWSLDTSTGVLTLSGSGYGKNYADKTGSRAPWYTKLYALSYLRTYIKELVVESGVKGIGDYAFYNCTNLEKVTFADTVDTLGSDCFKSCTSLKSITLPSGCSWYYKELFYGCTSLKWAVLPNTNSTDNYSGKVPEGTFSGCTSLEEVYVGSGHTAADASAFYNCTSLRGVIWDSREMSSVGTNAFSGVPSYCTFVSAQGGLESWAADNGYSYSLLGSICSDNTYSSEKLSYSFDTSAFKLSFSGSGDMSSKPWSVFHYFIKDISFAGTDGTFSVCANAFEGCENLGTVVFNMSCGGELHFYAYAFSGCTGTAAWINLPANTRYIDNYAFYGTNFNYVTADSENMTIGEEVFGNGSGGYARFYGISGSGLYDYVKSGQSKGYDWHYYCLGDKHTYTVETVAPTCTEKGYNVYSCSYCDAPESYGDYTEPLGHSYKYSSSDDTYFIYSCSRCASTDFKFDKIAVRDIFRESISHANDNAPYNQSNYNGVADVYTDGYVNARDFLIIDGSIKSISAQGKRTEIDESTVYQTIEGFGASGAWWAQSVGNWENIDEITELLYGSEKGIGLNIYRYNLGAGSQDDSVLYETGKRTSCFLQSDGTYDWDADAGAMNALASARRANSKLKVTLFCNSAPSSMTDNGHAFCSPVNSDGSYNSNLSESNYQAFADYVVKCAEHFIDEGYDVSCVSPINEPEWSWAAWYNDDGSISMNQEGCNWTASDARNFYNNYMIPALQSSSKLNGVVDLSIWESGQINHSSYWENFLNYMFSSSKLSGYSSANSNIRSYCDSIDVHSYWVSQSDRETVASQLTGSNYSAISKVRCTEYCQMTNDGNTGVYDLIQQAVDSGGTNGMTIEYGIALADIMYQDLTILNAVEWDWWVACARGIYPDALIYVNDSDHSDVQTSKRLWAMGNYSRFIDEGAKRISVSTQSGITSDIKESAYLNPDGSVAVVYINSGDTAQYTAFDSSSYTGFTSYVTDERHDLDRYQSGITDGAAVIIPAKSVTTVVLEK